MKIQRIHFADGSYSWLVLDSNLLPIKPIESFIRYLDRTEKSPNTVKCYANHLKLFWEYLTINNKDWTLVTVDEFANLVYWLRSNHSNVILLKNNNNIKRTEKTVNTILAALSSFYRFHNQLGNTSIQLTESCYLPANKFKSLLYHVYKNKPIQKRIISLKEPKKLPTIFNSGQISRLIDACSNARDRFLISLLVETGLRIGQALALRHEDIKSWDNEIYVVFRANNINQARNKSMRPNIIHVTKNLIQLYSDYVINNCKNTESEYVFINHESAQPLSYSAIRKLFIKLSNALGLHVTPHMLRHTHATELIRSGWDASFVQKRLGHTSVQTTLTFYAHLDRKDLKHAFQQYQEHKTKKEINNERK